MNCKILTSIHLYASGMQFHLSSERIYLLNKGKDLNILLMQLLLGSKTGICLEHVLAQRTVLELLFFLPVHSWVSIWLFCSVRGRGGALGQLRGGGGSGRGFGRGRGRGRGRGEKVSAEDLDADLEKYHSESMQIN